MIIFTKTAHTVQTATNMKPKSEHNAGKELAAHIKTYFLIIIPEVTANVNYHIAGTARYATEHERYIFY
jgi:hypothetical protein